MQRLKAALQFLLAHLLLTAVMLFLLLLDAVFSGWLLWGPVVSGPSSAPGARDGGGILVLFAVWIGCTFACTAVLGGLQVWVLKSLFPWWEPPDHSEL